MSESMSAVEIEDVLSSIRRLVSEDLRPTHKLVTAALQQSAAKLILTPALRVVSNEQPGFVHKADDLDEPRDLQSVLATIEDSAPQDTVEAIPMFGSVRLQEMADIRGDAGIADDSAMSDANFLASAMSRINGLAMGDATPPAPPETIEAVVAAVGAAVGPDEWELDGGEPAPQAQAWSDTVWHTADPADAAPEPQTGAVPLLLCQPADSVDEAIATAGEGVTASPPSDDADTAPAQDVTSVEPVTAVDTAIAVTQSETGRDRIIFHDDAVASDTAHLAVDATDTRSDRVAVPPAASSPVHDDIPLINEDLLRDIVRDLMKAELQGSLGEHITQNVRKLVRSEINRALASRDHF